MSLENEWAASNVNDNLWKHWWKRLESVFVVLNLNSKEIEIIKNAISTENTAKSYGKNRVF